ncbi:band 7 protein AGAP004871 isoform X2 [Drosophila mojavensis]|uniref:band 7 protein AGAP004871 isoform X2 n=1 Tax=Drosophila mojavensis TaxID=7230 RepID=UPI0013EE65C5|nr:band 7 protein AGAP004871 isoform X2 [Drosophila mojavensis]
MGRNSPVYSNYEDLHASELPSVSNSHAVSIMRPEQMPEPEYQQTNVKSGSPPEYRGFKTLLFFILTCPISVFFCLKIVAEYERAIIFRLGRLCGGPRGPGMFFVLPCIDQYRKVDLRTVTFNVPQQEMLTKDSVTVTVDAVVYYRIHDPLYAIVRVEDYSTSTRLLAATTLRNIVGTRNLTELLTERETLAHNMQLTLDEATEPWGVMVERVEIKDVSLPASMQRAMAAEAEASRDARAKVIAAEGEKKSATALKEASDVISSSPSALQLRYLQTLSSISAEKNSTIVFPLPMELLTPYLAKYSPMASLPPKPLQLSSDLLNEQHATYPQQTIL